jgi:hypothetical protein
LIANIVKDKILLRPKYNTLDFLDAHVVKYTDCTRRNLPFFGRKFLRFRYIDITKKTYIRSRTVMEMTRENCNLAVPRTVPV